MDCSAGYDNSTTLSLKCLTLVDTLTGIPQIDAASREETSGKFLSFDETPLMW